MKLISEVDADFEKNFKNHLFKFLNIMIKF